MLKLFIKLFRFKPMETKVLPEKAKALYEKEVRVPDEYLFQCMLCTEAGILPTYKHQSCNTFVCYDCFHKSEITIITRCGCGVNDVSLSDFVLLDPVSLRGLSESPLCFFSSRTVNCTICKKYKGSVRGYAEHRRKDGISCNLSRCVNGCGSLYESSAMLLHLPEFPRRPAECNFKSLGCKWTGPILYVGQHDSDCSKEHVQLSTNTRWELKKEMEKVEELKREITELRKGIDTRRTLIDVENDCEVKEQKSEKGRDDQKQTIKKRKRNNGDEWVKGQITKEEIDRFAKAATDRDQYELAIKGLQTVVDSPWRKNGFLLDITEWDLVLTDVFQELILCRGLYGFVTFRRNGKKPGKMSLHIKPISWG
jgi:hypothetical protein